MKKRTGEPWMRAGDYGRALPALTVNLLVRDVERSVAFYRDALAAEVRYSDPDFGAIRVAGMDFMLHADHTYEKHPWHSRLSAGGARGLGAELRLLGVDPDVVASRAAAGGGKVLREPLDTHHGWREAWVEDPDGYVWAVGTPMGG